LCLSLINDQAHSGVTADSWGEARPIPSALNDAKGDADALSGSFSQGERVRVRVVAQPVVPGWAGSGLVGDETPLTPGPSPSNTVRHEICAIILTILGGCQDGRKASQAY
jgi:hypothetical protein